MNIVNESIDLTPLTGNKDNYYRSYPASPPPSETTKGSKLTFVTICHVQSMEICNKKEKDEHDRCLYHSHHLAFALRGRHCVPAAQTKRPAKGCFHGGRYTANRRKKLTIMDCSDGQNCQQFSSEKGQCPQYL